MTNTALEDLWEELDRSALHLLRQAMAVGGGALPVKEGEVTLPPAGGSLNERVRVFTAISAYAKSRQEAGPQGPKSGKSGFDELQHEFRSVGSGNGGGGERRSPERRTRAGKKAPQTNGSAFGAASGHTAT